MRLVYLKLVDNYTRSYILLCINMSEIEDEIGMELDELLQQVHLGQLKVVDWCVS